MTAHWRRGWDPRRYVRRSTARLLLLAASVLLAARAEAQPSFENGGRLAEETPTPRVTPRASDWEQPNPVPTGYVVERRLRWNLLIRGAGLLLVTYSFTAVGSAGSRDRAALWVPVAGPFIQLGQPSDRRLWTVPVLVGDGLLQAAAAAAIAYAALVPKQVIVKERMSARVTVLPMLSYTGGSLYFTGSF
jgi:hypothetical protein